MYGRRGKEPAIPEQFAYSVNKKPADGEDDLPFRHLQNVTIYNRKGEMVGLEAIEREGPFTATGLPCPEDPDLMNEYREKLILLEDINEYSLEYPYGKEAIVWLNTDHAYYAIDSISADYRARKDDLFRVATLCGHIINAFINIRGERSFGRVILKAQRLSGMPLAEFIAGISRRRHFLRRQLDQQRIAFLRQTRFFNILNDSTRWTESGIQELTGLVEKEIRRQLRTHDLDSSEEDERKGAGVAEPMPSEPKAPESPKADASIHAQQSATVVTNEVAPIVDEQPTEAPESAITKLTETRDAANFLLRGIQRDVAIELPSVLALRYECPFCQLTLLRSHENINIVNMTRCHLQDHLRLGLFGNWAGFRTALLPPWPALTREAVSRPMKPIPLLYKGPSGDLKKHPQLPITVGSDIEDAENTIINSPEPADLAPTEKMFQVLNGPIIVFGRNSSVPITIDD